VYLYNNFNNIVKSVRFMEHLAIPERAKFYLYLL